VLAAALALTAFGQKAGDKITINTTETGRTTEWNLAGESNAVSSLRHTADGKLEVYLKGWEDFGAWETYDVGKISSVILTCSARAMSAADAGPTLPPAMPPSACTSTCA
jgi:hypothetical protein